MFKHFTGCKIRMSLNCVTFKISCVLYDTMYNGKQVRHFAVTSCLHFQGIILRRHFISAYICIRLYNLQERNFHNHRCDNLKSQCIPFIQPQTQHGGYIRGFDEIKKQCNFSVNSELFVFYVLFTFMFIYYLRNTDSFVNIVIRLQGGRPRMVVQFASEKRGRSLFQSVKPSVEPSDFPILWYRRLLPQE